MFGSYLCLLYFKCIPISVSTWIAYVVHFLLVHFSGSYLKYGCEVIMLFD